MTENTLNFSKKSILNLTASLTGRSVYYDQQKRGLIVMVYPSGTKSFALYRKVNGKPERISIGRFPDVSIEHARK